MMTKMQQASQWKLGPNTVTADGKDLSLPVRDSFTFQHWAE